MWTISGKLELKLPFMIPNKQKPSKRNWCGHSGQHHNMTLDDSRSLAQPRTPSDSESIRFHSDWLNLDVRVRSLSSEITTNLNEIKPKMVSLRSSMLRLTPRIEMEPFVSLDMWLRRQIGSWCCVSRCWNHEDKLRMTSERCQQTCCQQIQYKRNRVASSSSEKEH